VPVAVDASATTSTSLVKQYAGFLNPGISTKHRIRRARET